MDNDYYSIAENDYKYMSATKHLGFNNNTAAQCQQIIEKLLKYVVERISVDAVRLLRTHNLRNLYREVEHEIVLSERAGLLLSTITDYYFDARYPGDDFINVTNTEVADCISTVEEVFKKVTEWKINNENLDNDLLTIVDDISPI